MSDESVKYVLSEARIPKAWYNLVADLPVPPPAVLHPGTGGPIGPSDLEPLFPMSLIAQEVSTERWIEIPDPVRDIYRMWRPSPLIRARRLEKALDTPAKIFFKYEGVSPAGSHKPNTAVAQAFYNSEAGVKRLTHRNGRRPVGLVARLRGATVRPRSRRVHGQGELRAKAVSPRAHGDVRRALRRQPVRPRRPPGGRSSNVFPIRPVRSASRSPKRSKSRRSARTRSTRSARCSTTSCCTRRSSAKRRSCS